MMSQFPNISDYLKKDASCQQAADLFKGRNLAQVFLKIYREIPEEENLVREKYKKAIDYFLYNDVSYKAPEIFGIYVWPRAINLVIHLINPCVYPSQIWRQKSLKGNRINQPSLYSVFVDLKIPPLHMTIIFPVPRNKLV